MKRKPRKIKPVGQADLTVSALRILHWFFAYSNRDFTFNEVCTATGTSKTTAKMIIESFFDQQLLKRTILGRLWRLTANQESERFKRAKISYNLGLIYENNIVELIRGKYQQARTIILFGSYRKGDDIEGSDIDIAVEISGATELMIDPAFQFEEIGYRRDVKVNLHIFSRSKIDINVFSNIANGIILDGFLEVKP